MICNFHLHLRRWGLDEIYNSLIDYLYNSTSLGRRRFFQQSKVTLHRNSRICGYDKLPYHSRQIRLTCRRTRQVACFWQKSRESRRPLTTRYRMRDPLNLLTAFFFGIFQVLAAACASTQ